MSVLRLALIIIAVFCLFDPFDDRSGAFPGRVVRDRHSRSLAGEQKGDRPADSRARSRDQGRFPFQRIPDAYFVVTTILPLIFPFSSKSWA